MQEWADEHGCSLRSVKRWVAAGEIPGAVLEAGRRLIPADATRQETLTATPAREVTHRASHPHGPTVPVTLTDALAQSTAFLDIETAARFLGISAHAVMADKARFNLERRGRSYVMPAAVVRDIAGLR